MIGAFLDEVEADTREGPSSAKVVKTSTNTRKTEFTDDTEIVKMWQKGRLSAVSPRAENMTLSDELTLCSFHVL